MCRQVGRVGQRGEFALHRRTQRSGSVSATHIQWEFRAAGMARRSSAPSTAGCWPLPVSAAFRCTMRICGSGRSSSGAEIAGAARGDAEHSATRARLPPRRSVRSRCPGRGRRVCVVRWQLPSNTSPRPAQRWVAPRALTLSRKGWSFSFPRHYEGRAQF